MKSGGSNTDKAETKGCHRRAFDAPFDAQAKSENANSWMHFGMGGPLASLPITLDPGLVQPPA